ncbi:hypothetical protein [[Mycoplasma] gypis]|uniref:Uncharacterized protein n=1 Tax=[Mycoplasma] gypis TaxID=92404 RepID=A0ABZ2RQW4_9BACT|nr:hypothetical protein [[Mycoplasma] gypis]MBN0919447.1 hypothetical protein [[Mycoplasma] gypis]
MEKIKQLSTQEKTLIYDLSEKIKNIDTLWTKLKSEIHTKLSSSSQSLYKILFEVLEIEQTFEHTNEALTIAWEYLCEQFEAVERNIVEILNIFENTKVKQLIQKIDYIKTKNL